MGQVMCSAGGYRTDEHHLGLESVCPYLAHHRLSHTHTALPPNSCSRNHSFSESAKLFILVILSLRGLTGKQTNLRIYSGKKQGISYTADGKLGSIK